VTDEADPLARILKRIRDDADRWIDDFGAVVGRWKAAEQAGRDFPARPIRPEDEGQGPRRVLVDEFGGSITSNVRGAAPTKIDHRAGHRRRGGGP
jgi:hypothetical protein